MREKRPFALVVVGWLIVAAGAMGLVLGFKGAKTFWPPEQDLIWIAIVDIAGIVFGLFLLRGHNWARWLTLVWLGFHVVISFFNSVGAGVAHGVIFLMLGYLLVIRADVRAYFRSAAMTDKA